MKKIFLFCFLTVSFVSSVQFQYNPTYNNQQQRESAQKSSTQSARTTAYAIDSQRNVYKMLIVGEVTNNDYGGVTMRVTQRYVDNGLGGGRWRRFYSGGNVSKCLSFISSNPLEEEFMYKTTISGCTWYSDL